MVRRIAAFTCAIVLSSFPARADDYGHADLGHVAARGATTAYTGLTVGVAK